MSKGRPPLPLGTWGQISVARIGPSQYKARARFRDIGGTRVITANGQTKAKARQRLQVKLGEERTAVDSLASRTTTVEELADAWLATNGGRKQWSTRTRETYEQTVDKLRPLIGSVRFSELRSSALNRVIQHVLDVDGPGAAAHAKTVLSGICRLAVQNDLLASNLVRDTGSIPSRRSNPRALTVAEVESLTDALRADRQAVDLDLPDLVDWMLGTGCRIGEACAARKSALSVGSETTVGATWEINATLVRIRTRGLVIQPRPKTAAGWRVLALPDYIVAMLARRAGEARFQGPEGVIFSAPRANSLRDPSEAAKSMRAVFDRLGFEHVHSHMFRKTVATRLDEAGLSARQIADQLGHSKPSITMDRYMGRNVVSAEAAKILDR